MRFLNVLFMIIFLLSAALQYNDPDPYIWIPLYLLGFAICFLAFRRRFVPLLYLIGAVIYVPYAIYLFFEKQGVLSWWKEHDHENIAQTMKATKPWIEETREFGGILLLLLALVANWLWLRRRGTTIRKDAPAHSVSHP